MAKIDYERQRADICLAVMHRCGGDLDPRYIGLVDEAYQQGLFKRAYVYYFIHITIALLAWGSSFYFIATLSSPTLQFLNGLWFGFWSVQLGIIAHDLSHGMVLHRPPLSRFFATIFWGLIGGLSEYRWYEKHNKHHETPNHEGHDPDIDIPFVLDKHQLDGRSIFFKTYILPYQPILFWVSLPLVYLYNVAYGMFNLFSIWDKKSVIEIGLIVFHFGAVYGFIFTRLPLFPALCFVVASIGVIGTYMSLVFAPNHKSEEIITSDTRYSWTSQITSTRNVKSGYLTFFLLGGLNFQVEHHLFPAMARSTYFKANRLVREFCVREQIHYEETSWFKSMQDIHQLLKDARQ